MTITNQHPENNGSLTIVIATAQPKGGYQQALAYKTTLPSPRMATSQNLVANHTTSNSCFVGRISGTLVGFHHIVTQLTFVLFGKLGGSRA